MAEEKTEIKQGLEEYPLSPAEPQKMPDSTYWPFAMAIGVVLLIWGLITSLFIVAVGIVLMGVSLAGWIVDLKYE